MSENIPQQNHQEAEANPGISAVAFERVSSIVNAAKYNLSPEDGLFSEENSRVLAKFALQNNGNFGTILNDISGNTVSHELNEIEEKELQLLLMTPWYVIAQTEKDISGDRNRELRGNLIEYSTVMSALFELDPNRSVSDFLRSLETLALLLLEEPYLSKSTNIFRNTINGIRAELAMMQAIRSKAGEEAEIAFIRTSKDEDLRGIDMKAVVPIEVADDHVRSIPLEINVKSKRHHVEERVSYDQDMAYMKVEEGANLFTVFPGLEWNEMGDGVMLSTEDADKLGARVVPVLQKMAREQYEYWENARQRARLGRSALN